MGSEEHETAGADGRDPAAVAASTIAGTEIESLLRRAPSLAIILDPSGRILFANDAMRALTALPDDEAPGRLWVTGLVPTEDRDEVRAQFLGYIAAGAPAVEVEFPIVVGGGAVHRVSWAPIALRDARGEVAIVAALGEDLTARDEQRALTARLASAVEQTADSVVITGLDARIQYVNPAFERVTGYTAAEVIGSNPRVLSSGRQSPALYRRLWRTILAGRPWQGELVNRRKDGSLYVEDATITPVRNPAGEIEGYVGVKRDVTMVRELNDALDRAAAERSAFVHAIAGIKPSMGLEDAACEISDAMVMLAGVNVAGVVLFEDGTARLVGLSSTGAVPLVEGQLLPVDWARSLRERAETSWVEPRRGHEPDSPYGRVFAEAGIVVTAYVPLEDERGLLGVLFAGTEDADGRDRLVEQLPAAEELAAVGQGVLAPQARLASDRVEARSRVRAIIASGTFTPVFQPIVDMGTGEPRGFEALTRFPDGRRPDLVFESARDAGLLVELEYATLRRSLEAAMVLPAGTYLSINVSPEMLLAGEALATLLHGSSRSLVLEITEHDVVEDYEALRATLAVLRGGYGIAVDDAGAGEANLRHLVELRPDITKVDMSLVRGIDTDIARQAMVAGLQHFATTTGKALVAEGVETQDERRTLMDLGVTLGQGYLFGKPAAAETWGELITSGS
jgi:PAS domain S-box-containing protein